MRIELPSAQVTTNTSQQTIRSNIKKNFSFEQNSLSDLPEDNYLQNLGRSLIGVFASFFNLIFTLICCRTSEVIEKEMIFTAPVKKKVPPTELQQPTVVNETKPDDLFALTEGEQTNIFEIIHSMGTISYFSLMRREVELKRRGVKIEHVHPLAFLSYIFLNPTLKKDLPVIYNDLFLSGEFIGGLAKNFSKNLENLETYLQHFASTLHIKCDLLQSYFQKEKWENSDLKQQKQLVKEFLNFIDKEMKPL